MGCPFTSAVLRAFVRDRDRETHSYRFSNPRSTTANGVARESGSNEESRSNEIVRSRDGGRAAPLRSSREHLFDSFPVGSPHHCGRTFSSYAFLHGTLRTEIIAKNKATSSLKGWGRNDDVHAPFSLLSSMERGCCAHLTHRSTT